MNADDTFNLQRFVDPKAHDAFRARVIDQKKRTGNGFWWAPGETLPSRAPDFSHVFQK